MLDEAVLARQRIQALASDTSPNAQREKERLLYDAEDALDRARLLGDLVVGAFFSAEKDKAREAERLRRFDLVRAWLASGGSVPDELRSMQREIRKSVPVFHWMVEYPEIFYVEKPDPLEAGKVNRAAFMDAFIGNPPFLGGKRISSDLGDAYAEWMEVLDAGGKSGDLSAHFFLRADTLLGRHGTLGLVATNTISQGDTRTAGLQLLVRAGTEIYDATRSLSWPGDAAVSVSIVHMAKGAAATAINEHVLDGVRVEAINSRLRGKPERPDPKSLAANAASAFVGTFVLGLGFTLAQDERDLIVGKNPMSAQRVFPYLGGDEVNSSPTQSPHRYVINFARMQLDEAAEWPDLVEIVRARVKSERDALRDTPSARSYKTYWWRFGRWSDECYAAIGRLRRCVVTAIVSKHLMFSFQPTDRVFSHKLCVFPFEDHTQFAILQSRTHAAWTWLLSSTLEDRLNYSASDCFDTFPFPHPSPHTVLPELETIGMALDDARAKYMVDTQQGLTQTYNALKAPTVTDPRIAALRTLHEALDRAVLAAYGWSDIAVPPFVTPETDEAKKDLESFEDEIIDRLFVLNAARADEEAKAGLGTLKKMPASNSKKPATKKPPSKARAKKPSPSKPEQEDLDLD